MSVEIQTDQEYRQAIKEVEPLLEAEPGTPEFDRVNTLVNAIQAYERIHYPIAPPSPEAAAQYEREKRGGLVAA
jgi:HTH-type transcriptional regulator/antitoxin HigA